MTGNTIYDVLLIGIFASALLTALVLLKIDAPYGRHKREGWGPKIPTRLGWVVMEAPASLVFFWFYFTGPNAGNLVCIVLLILWQLHYVHRAFIYPFQIKVKPGSSEPLLVIGMGSLYCGINGYLNGAFVSTYGEHLNDAWLTDPRFILGIALFFAGYYINKKSDAMLRALRASSKDYQIPRGFAFNYVSMPNYLGEILTWCGFALACWSLAGLSFVLFTMANLVPRALTNHRWYREKFVDYPPNRKAIFPWVL